MKIYIPTRGRARIRTYERLCPIMQKYNVAIVQSEFNERQFHLEDKYELSPSQMLFTPPRLDGIAATRQWILDHATRMANEPIVLMLDDDLPTWCQRNPDPVPETGEDATYHKADVNEVDKGFREFATLMKKYAHGAIGHRLFCQRHPPLYHNSRMLRALAYNIPMIKAAGVRFRLPVMEDFDMQLQLLTKGYDCLVYNKVVQDQYGTNIEGGCAAYRTPELQEKAANDLARIWPGIVTVTTRKPKRAWGNMEEGRVDVRVNWRKAILQGHSTSMGGRHART